MSFYAGSFGANIIFKFKTNINLIELKFKLAFIKSVIRFEADVIRVAFTEQKPNADDHPRCTEVIRVVADDHPRCTDIIRVVADDHPRCTEVIRVVVDGHPRCTEVIRVGLLIGKSIADDYPRCANVIRVVDA